jgi:hypothetical protein
MIAAENHASGLHAKNRPEALAARKNAVAHCLMNGSGMLRGGRQKPFERRVGDGASLFKYRFQHRTAV